MLIHWFIPPERRSEERRTGDNKRSQERRGNGRGEDKGKVTGTVEETGNETREVGRKGDKDRFEKRGRDVMRRGEWKARRRKRGKDTREEWRKWGEAGGKIGKW